MAEELSRRWQLTRWRFTNSGTESTLGAIRIARGLTGRSDILKIFGSYHGHHDGVMVSVGVEPGPMGPGDASPSLPYGDGVPPSTVDGVHALHFNDATAMERASGSSRVWGESRRA